MSTAVKEINKWKYPPTFPQQQQQQQKKKKTKYMLKIPALLSLSLSLSLFLFIYYFLFFIFNYLLQFPFKFLAVAECKATSFTGVSGIMIRETAETFGIITQDGIFRGNSSTSPNFKLILP